MADKKSSDDRLAEHRKDVEKEAAEKKKQVLAEAQREDKPEDEQKAKEQAIEQSKLSKHLTEPGDVVGSQLPDDPRTPGPNFKQDVYGDTVQLEVQPLTDVQKQAAKDKAEGKPIKQDEEEDPHAVRHAGPKAPPAPEPKKK